MIPLMVLGGFGLFEYINNLLSYDEVNAESLYYALSREVLLISIVPLFWLTSFFRSHLPKRKPYATFVLISWSIVLWQGIILGYLDALLGRNGH
jgi:hypothetical protein